MGNRDLAGTSSEMISAKPMACQVAWVPRLEIWCLKKLLTLSNVLVHRSKFRSLFNKNLQTFR